VQQIKIIKNDFLEIFFLKDQACLDFKVLLVELFDCF
jgi:hypothetical protein